MDSLPKDGHLYETPTSPESRNRRASAIDVVERDAATDATLAGAFVDERRDSHVLQRHSRAVEDQDLARGFPPGLASHHDLAELRMDVAALHRTRAERMVGVPERGGLID